MATELHYRWNGNCQFCAAPIQARPTLSHTRFCCPSCRRYGSVADGWINELSDQFGSPLNLPLKLFPGHKGRGHPQFFAWSRSLRTILKILDSGASTTRSDLIFLVTAFGATALLVAPLMAAFLNLHALGSFTGVRALVACMVGLTVLLAVETSELNEMRRVRRRIVARQLAMRDLAELQSQQAEFMRRNDEVTEQRRARDEERLRKAVERYRSKQAEEDAERRRRAEAERRRQEELAKRQREEENRRADERDRLQEAERQRREAIRIEQIRKEQERHARLMRTKAGVQAVLVRMPADPSDFEEVCAEWLRQVGYPDAKSTPHGPDGGVDVLGHAMIAQCKLYMGSVIPVSAVRQLYGVQSQQGAQVAHFFLYGIGYSAEAIRFADEVKMMLWQLEVRSSTFRLVNQIFREPPTSVQR